jgi:DNA-binding response OmpR family regulator
MDGTRTGQSLQQVGCTSSIGYQGGGFQRSRQTLYTKDELTVRGNSLRDTETGSNILIIEDDVPLGKFLSRELGRREFAAHVRTDGRQACSELLERSDFDLLILDLNLPGTDGMELLRRVRTKDPQLPILVLTARNRTEDLVEGLNEGADDFLVKPFSLKELIARVNRLVRRGTPAASENGTPRRAELTLHPASYTVMRGDRRIELTPREFAILEYLMAHPGNVVSRKDLIEQVWQTSYDSTSNVVDVYMKYLRDKLDGEGERKIIRTVRGVGYVLELDSDGTK